MLADCAARSLSVLVYFKRLFPVFILILLCSLYATQYVRLSWNSITLRCIIIVIKMMRWSVLVVSSAPILSLPQYKWERCIPLCMIFIYIIVFSDFSLDVPSEGIARHTC